MTPAQLRARFAGVLDVADLGPDKREHLLNALVAASNERTSRSANRAGELAALLVGLAGRVGAYFDDPSSESAAELRKASNIALGQLRTVDRPLDWTAPTPAAEEPLWHLHASGLDVRRYPANDAARRADAPRTAVVCRDGERCTRSGGCARLADCERARTVTEQQVDADLTRRDPSAWTDAEIIESRHLYAEIVRLSPTPVRFPTVSGSAAFDLPILRDRVAVLGGDPWPGAVVELRAGCSLTGRRFARPVRVIGGVQYDGLRGWLRVLATKFDRDAEPAITLDVQVLLDLIGSDR